MLRGYFMRLVILYKLNSKYYRFNLSVLDTIEYVVYKGEEDGRYDWHHDYNEGLSAFP